MTPFPDWLGDLGRAAVHDVYGDARDHRPDIAVINHYDADARMGLHRDADEVARDPVVSLSIGAPCVFRRGGAVGRPGRVR